MSGAPIHQNFPALYDSLDMLDNTQRAAMAKKEELQAELAAWAGFWHGDAHDAAMAWSNNVSARLEHSIQAAQNYSTTARTTIMDMQATENANVSQWV